MTSLPLAMHDVREPVAFGAGGERSAGDLLRDAANVAAQLPASTLSSNLQTSQVLLAISRDRYAFAAALLGIWARGYSAAIPPHTGREAILAIAPHSVAVIHDGATLAPLRIDQLLGNDHTGSLALPLELPDPLATFYDEDVDGVWRAYPKRRHQLLNEAVLLVDAFDLRRGMRYASALPVGEPYAFVLGLLVPLVSGGAFLREVSNPVGDARADVLVSVPRQLRRTPELGRFARVFSALAPLTAAVKHPVIDLFVTRADGIVAARSHPNKTAFAPLPGASQTAPIGPTSPELQTELEEVERKLAAISGSEEFIVIASAGELFALLVAPTRDEAELTARLHAQLERSRPHLACVARLPRFSEDHASHARVLQLFRRSADGRPLQFRLDWQAPIEQDQGEQRRRVFRVHVPLDYGYFAGHFTGYPILPGAAQLSELVLPCVRRARPDLGPLRQMNRIKFSNRIKPDEAVDVVLSWRGAESLVEFALRRDDTLCSAGKLNFAVAP
jgi:hypothetical protein